MSTGIAASKKFEEDELFKTVYKYNFETREQPDLVQLEKRFPKKIAYIYTTTVAAPVQPYNAMKYYMVDQIDMIVVGAVSPHDDTIEDPSLECYGMPPCSDY